LILQNPSARSRIAEISEQGWANRVAGLTPVLPDIVSDMATHIEWAKTIGTAMLAKSDDVLAEVQVMRETAMQTGALSSSLVQTFQGTPKFR